ncbi:LuxR family transcriptional regulator [Nocardia sp. XZ_19_369]|uniref:helix-turn-helix transcriptional regulator n=1 Tax=Nocardia sp. XZ_19_369 TaxID=2769487 RepID=UPI0018907EA3|nr:LuxR family transcriptional regulator [Nocardia sp. XZ_19_369]
MHSTQHPNCPTGSALPPGVALHRPERLGSNGNARLSIGDRETWRIAQAIAVLDESATPTRVAALLEADESAVRSVLGRLTAAGLIDATTTRFHQSEFRERVLRHTAVDARKRLSHRAAGLLHLDDESPRTVAGLLLAAGYARYPWAPAVLVSAADDAMVQNQIYRAVQCLTLAYRVSLHAADRADISARMLSIEWQVKPSPTTRSYLRTTVAARAGLLDERMLRFLVRYALWHGQVDDAQVALEALERSASTDANPDEVAFFYAWLAYTHPDVATRGPREVEPAGDTGAAASADRQAATVLSAITAREPVGRIAIAAQELLTEHRLNPATVEPLATAIDGLVHAERLDLAQTWCDVLLAEANARSAPTWQSVFAGLRAEVSLRRGDLTAAEHYAQRALNQVAAKNLGTWVGSPVGTLIRALTAAGRYREAQTQLDRAVPLPMFASRFGLRYLHARGHLHLATHRFHDAIEDFRTCGELMQRWQIDLPVVVPWRNDLAQAYSAMGDTDNARTYARLHISHLGRADAHRTGGVSLRLLAATGTQQDRLVLLHESEAIARVHDDQLEIALVLGDLADAYRRMGQPDRARALHRNADRLARRCGVKPLSGNATTEEPPVSVRSPAEIRSALSPAELRVATLAADGERNRDIADQLGITTSTVEQHLTRVFRKLHVGSRSELRFAMRTDDLLS